jgi:hypothetical protein
VWSTLIERLKALGADWSIYSALGSFGLYFLGYLVLRFQLSAWGVTTDLAMLDERYFFAGARFVVYLTSTIVSVLFLASPLLLLWHLMNRSTRVRRWREKWNYALTGVIFAVLFVQLVERKCFQFMGSQLVQRRLEGDEWLRKVLLDPSSTREALFFAVLVAGVAATGWLLAQSRSQGSGRPFLQGLLVFLFAVEFLLLPVNYGVIVSTKHLPRVKGFGGSEAWLVWEGKDKTTFLVADQERRLVAVPNDEVKTLEITGVDDIFQRLYAQNPVP